MFDEFLKHGSVLAVVCMTYASDVFAESLRWQRLYPHNTPMILLHPASALLMLAAIPCVIWPAIYIGLFSGFVAGIVGWLGLQIISAVATLLLGIRGPLLGFHFILACVAYPLGYYISLTNLP